VARAARQSALEEIGSALAHKLNQPLTAVILYLQAIGRAYDRETSGRRLPDAVAAILEKAVHEAERASGMLQTLRHVPRCDDERPRFADVNQVLEDAIDLVGVRVRPGLQIDHDLAPCLPAVQIERFELQQALIALIRGAVEDSRGRDVGGIRLTTHCSCGQVAVVVETAVGDGGELADNCAASTNGRRNCEKDLAIARAIAQNHGGNLVVDADGQDRGARFTLRLPVPAGSASSA
jgi:two-component system sensor kinase FixL